MSRLKLLSLALFVMAMVLRAVAFNGPELARDLRYAGTFRVADDLRATKDRCRRYVFLVSLCSAKIHSVRNERSTNSTEFLMFFRSGAGAELIPVRSNVDASAVGIQYAVTACCITASCRCLASRCSLAGSPGSSWTASARAVTRTDRDTRRSGNT